MTHRWTAGVRREVLPNGLTLLVHRDPTAPAVAVVSHVRAGFFDEPDHQIGVSHVLEHMLFKGTPTRRVGEIARETKAAGGYLNAATSYDRTSYYTVLPAVSLPVALDLQADALRRSLIDPAELRRELVVIIEEAKRKLDAPGAVTAETLNAVLFDRHRIRRWRIGTESHLAALPHQEVMAYYRSRYVPGRTVVAMAGELDPEAALAMARDLFGGWPAAESALDPSPEEPAHREVRLRILTGDVRRAHLMAGWRGVPVRHPDAPALDIAATVLGAGRASWLYRTLRAPGLVISAGAGHYATTEVGVFSLGAELDPDRLDAALAGLAAAVTRLQTEGPSYEDLDRVRTIIETRWARALESAEGRAAALAAAEAQGGYQLLDEDYQRLLAVTPEDVRRVSREWLAPDAVAVVAYLPERAPHSLGVEAVARCFRSAVPAKAASVPSPRIRPAPPRPVQGKVTSGVLHVELPAADLLIGRKPGVPLVSLGVYRRRTVAESRATAGLGALAVRSAVRGAGPFDADQIALGFERSGGSVAAIVTADWFGFGTSVLVSAATDAAALLEQVLTRPRLDAGEVERERATLADEAAQAADDMVRFPMQLALSSAFGTTGYGLPVLGLTDSVPQLTPGMVRAWHACELAQGRTTVVAVGDIDPEMLAGQLAGIFGEGPARAPVDLAAPMPRADTAGPPASVVERARKQTALALLFPGPARRSPARHAAQVWAAMSGGLGGRLFTALRDTRSLAYSVMASSWQRAGAGGLLLYLATSPGREAEARAALLEELGRFRTEDCGAEELARAISYLAGQAQVRRQTASAVAGEIAEAWLVGEGLIEVSEPTAEIRAVTASAVRALAETCLVEGTRAEGVVRGTADERPEYVSGQPAMERV